MPLARPIFILAALAVSAAAIAMAAAASGPMQIAIAPLLASLLRDMPLAGPEAHVFWNIRMPRVLLAFVTGGALALAGAALQGLFRNGLADPGLIGVSSGAALGAVAVIVLTPFSPLAPQTAILQPLAAFAVGGAVSALVYRLAVVEGRVSIPAMLLAGIAVNALCAAAIGLFSYFSTEDQLRLILFWTLGSFGAATWLSFTIAGFVLFGAIVMMVAVARALNALLLGERQAAYLGVDVARVKRRVLIGAVLATAGGTAFVGIIGFVGLVAPHIVRLMTGPDHRFVLPGSFLLGGALVVAADAMARTVVAPAEMPIGILTAALGAPFFLALLWRRRHDMEAG
jgi:iron complex transport system permease protein